MDPTVKALGLSFDCFAEYYGIGGTKDWPKARACFSFVFERFGSCADSSPELSTVFLAVMEALGQGGPVARSKAVALLQDCYEDETVKALRDAARGGGLASRRSDSVDPCRDVPLRASFVTQCSHMKEDLQRAFDASADASLAVMVEAMNARAALTRPCFEDFYGVGRPKDWPRARACFAQAVQRDDVCDASPGLPRVFLAVMETAGLGGPEARADAIALLQDCFGDVTVDAVRKAAEGQGPIQNHAGAVDPCRDLPLASAYAAECIHMRGALRAGGR
jgi:hypothetical protein